MTKHLADHRMASSGGKLRHFLQLSRTARATWHRPRSAAGKARVVQFLRIERGRTA
jgi:hypothetical protein